MIFDRIIFQCVNKHLKKFKNRLMAENLVEKYEILKEY